MGFAVVFSEAQSEGEGTAMGREDFGGQPSIVDARVPALSAQLLR